MDLHLPTDIETTLREHAHAAGMDIEQLEQFAIVALQKGLSDIDTSLPSESTLSRDKWQELFQAFLADLPRRSAKTRVDTSRESIYGDRGR